MLNCLLPFCAHCNRVPGHNDIGGSVAALCVLEIFSPQEECQSFSRRGGWRKEGETSEEPKHPRMMVMEAASVNVWWAVVIRKLWDLSKMLREQTKLWAVPGTGVYVKEVWSYLCPTILSWPFCELLYNPRAQPGILEGLRCGCHWSAMQMDR